MDKKNANERLKGKRAHFVEPKNKKPALLYVVLSVAVVAIVGFIVAYANSGKTPGSVQPTAAEAKYIGRYLPSDFKPEKLTEPVVYDRRIDMVPVIPEVKDGKVIIKAGDVIVDRIVSFEYLRPKDGQSISMMAYIKPSGELFTGVSYCPPCQAKYHHFEADGTLTCNACGTKRDPETEAGISGSCKLYPADAIAHELVGKNIELAEADLADWEPQPLDRPVGDE
ncbi:MAG: DUF2318 domain-containing protein [Actinobacteria bacterium]|nr:DUF2318 domain-containing protein [Actinomycetota bacterium]